MPYILIFSLTVGLITLTHSVAMVVILSVLVYLVSRYEVRKFIKKDRVVYAMLIIAGVMSVVYYDYRVLGSRDILISSYQGITRDQRLSGEEQFVVIQRERVGRYSIEQTDDADQDLLLYTSQLLNPGDILLTNRQPIWREYYPEICVMICRQDGQVIDNRGFDYDRWLYVHGVVGSLYDNKVFVVGRESLGGLANVRENFFQTVVGRFSDFGSSHKGISGSVRPERQNNTNITAGLILGMTIGDRSLIEKSRYDQFISSGLVHLIAVSGGNIAIVVLFIGMLLFWVPFYIRQVILIVAILSYAVIVGDDSSVIRATVMGLLTLIVLFPGRQLSIWRSIAYARCAMLLRNPYYLLYDMGFILSFSAVVGIVWAEKTLRITRDMRGDNPQSFLQGWISTGSNYFLGLYIIPTIGAIIGVTPWLLYSMETTNLLSPLVNIAIVPLVPLITVGSFVVPYLPVGWWSDTLIVRAMDYIARLSTMGTQYGVYVSLVSWAKILFLTIMCLYWVYWIDGQVSIDDKIENNDDS